MNSNVAQVERKIAIAEQAKLTHDQSTFLFMTGASNNGDNYPDFQMDLHKTDPELLHRWMQDLMTRGLLEYNEVGKLTPTAKGRKLNEAFTTKVIEKFGDTSGIVDT